MNKSPDESQCDSHNMLSFLSCQANATDGDDWFVVAVFGTDNVKSPLLNRFNSFHSK
jgi:hypothetical protein